jgi:hypothetical protein
MADEILPPDSTWIPYSPLERGWRRVAWWWLAWVPAGVGLLAWIVVLIDPEAGFIWRSLLPLFWITVYTLSVILHELGHFYAARLVGFRPMMLSIGYGPCLLLNRFASGLTLSVRALPVSGYVFAWPCGEKHLRLRWFLMTLAGPAVNIALVLAVWGLEEGWWFQLSVRDLVGKTFGFIFFSNLILAISSLVPYSTCLERGRWESDGLMLWRLMFGAGETFWRGMSYWNEQFGARCGSAKEAEDSKGWSQNWRDHIQSFDPHLMIESYRQLLREPQLTAEARLGLLDSFATTVLMYNAREFLSEADMYSEELHRAKPTEWSVMGTRGSILVEIGRTEEGIEMLRAVVENDPLAFDQAISAAFIALGEIKKGRLEAAEEWLNKAREFDPNCVALDRIAACLSAAAQCVKRA